MREIALVRHFVLQEISIGVVFVSVQMRSPGVLAWALVACLRARFCTVSSFLMFVLLSPYAHTTEP